MTATTTHHRNNKHKNKKQPQLQAPPPCPYCSSTQITRAGKRYNQNGPVQLYSCTICSRKFRDRTQRNTTYPIRAIIETLSLYNRGYTLEESARRAGKKHRLTISRQTASTWMKRYSAYFPYFKIRSTIASNYSPHTLITTTRLHHGQVYGFEYHQGKTAHILAHNKSTAALSSVQTYLEAAPAETPHDVFRDERGRASQNKAKFSLNEVAIKERQNIAVDMAAFVIPKATSNYRRHETIQAFMLANDTATVAVEVPVYLTHTDIEHYKHTLGFTVPIDLSEGETITGHIDILQIRGGHIHIVDYKPGAKRDNFIKNSTRMAYKRLRAIKMPIGSGSVESVIRCVVNLRIKGPCISWCKENAEVILMIRCYWKTGRWYMLKNIAKKFTPEAYA